MTQAIVYTKTDESPMMSTYSLFPIFESFLSKGRHCPTTIDISLAGRILARFPEYLEDEQRVEDALENLGRIGTRTPCKRDEVAKYIGVHPADERLYCRTAVEGLQRSKLSRRAYDR